MNFLRSTFILLPVLLAACANTGPSTDYLDKDGYSVKIASQGAERNPDIVRVVRQEQFKNMLVVNREPGSEPNQHPLQIEPAALGTLLQEIRITRSKGEPEHLFDDDHLPELKEFSKWLADALATAGPGHDILFHFPQNRGLGLITENMMTTGRVFVRSGKLNIIFGDIQQYYEGQWLKAHIAPRFEIASRKASILQGRDLVNHTRAKRAEPTRNDWVVLNLEAISPATMQGISRPGGQVSGSAEDRLQKLQQLKSKGLISDEEFEIKRKQILDNI